MYMKICSYCQGKSYSASEYGIWICPYCKRDISDVKVRTIDDKEDESK